MFLLNVLPPVRHVKSAASLLTDTGWFLFKPGRLPLHVLRIVTYQHRIVPPPLLTDRNGPPLK